MDAENHMAPSDIAISEVTLSQNAIVQQEHSSLILCDLTNITSLDLHPINIKLKCLRLEVVGECISCVEMEGAHNRFPYAQAQTSIVTSK